MNTGFYLGFEWMVLLAPVDWALFAIYFIAPTAHWVEDIASVRSPQTNGVVTQSVLTM